MPISPSPSSAPEPARWWSTPFQMFQTNLREVDAGLDVEAVLDVIEAHGADTWLLNTGGIVSFHPTDLAFQTRNPHLAQRPSGDLVGDALAAAHRRGIRLLARMDFSKVTRRIAAENPGWCFARGDGLRQEYNGLVSVCPSGEYYQLRMFDILDEVIDRYPVDGFFFNWFGFNEVDYSRTYHGPCHCSSCRRAFGQFSGGEGLPTGPGSPSYDRWRAFVAATIDDLTTRVRTHIARRRPDAGLILGQAADIMFHEANNAVGRELWPHATSEAVSAFRSHRPSVPVLVNAVAFIDMPYRMAGEQAEHFAQYLIQAIARGANPSTYIMGVPGQIPYECLDVAGEVTRFHRRWRDVYTGLAPAARTALVRMASTGADAIRRAEATAEFRGLYSALQQRHVPFDVVAQEHLADLAATGGLARYSLLVLPDLGPLSGGVPDALDRFTTQGGRLLSTGSTAIRDDTVQLAALPAIGRTAVRAGASHLYGSYVATDPGGAEAEHRYPPPVLPIHGAYHYLSWSPDAIPRLSVLSQAPYGPPEKCYGHVPVGHPGYVLGDHGHGRTAVVPWTIGRTYHDLGLTAVRDVVVELALELLDGAEPVRAELPECVEITVHRAAGRTVVHLINMSGVRRNTFGPPLPISGGILRVAGLSPGAAVRALVADQECDVVDDDGVLAVHLPDLHLFEVVVITEQADSNGMGG